MKASLRFLSLSLLFRDKRINQKFLEETHIFQKSCFKSLTGILIIMSSYPAFVSIDKNNVFRGTILPALSIFISFSLYYLMVMRFLKKFVEFFIFLFLSIVVIYPLEFVDKTHWDSDKMYFFSSGLQLVIVLPIILRVSWRRYCLMIIFLQAYFSLRNFSLQKMQEMNMHPIIAFAIHSSILVMLHYSSERESRCAFHERCIQETSLEVFKTILTEMIPSAAIVVKERDIIFSNKASHNIIPHSTISELKSKLDDVRVKANSDYEYEHNLVTDMELMQSSKPCIPDVEGFIGLKELIRDFQLKDHYSLIPQFRFYQGFLKCETNEMRFLKKAIDIHIGEIIWDKDKVILILLNDVSANIRIQYLKTIGEYKDKLLATVSHDLRTPLNGMIGMLEVASENLMDRPADRKLLNMSMKSANLLLYMINDILDYSQITSEKLRLNFETINMITLVKEVSKLIKFQAKKKNVTFKIINNVNPCIGLMCNTDGNRVKQVLLNLLGNALKFTTKGFINVELNRKTDRGPFLISVEDSGIGIKQEDQGKLFKLFGKLEQSDRNINKSGVGLGLAVSQSIVKMMNDNKGEITLKSEYGKGSLFQFEIFSKIDFNSDVTYGSQEILITEEHPSYHSIRVVEYNSNTICTMDEIIELQKTEKKRILIVDDDQINIMVEVNFLMSVDYCCYEIVYNGKEAIDKILSNKKENLFYDVILMDCNMPVMDGFQASKIIREMIEKKEIPPLKIIAVTANASENDKIICKEHGMDYFVTKPLRKHEICSLIFKICNEGALV